MASLDLAISLLTISCLRFSKPCNAVWTESGTTFSRASVLKIKWHHYRWTYGHTFYGHHTLMGVSLWMESQYDQATNESFWRKKASLSLQATYLELTPNRHHSQALKVGEYKYTQKYFFGWITANINVYKRLTFSINCPIITPKVCNVKFLCCPLEHISLGLINIHTPLKLADMGTFGFKILATTVFSIAGKELISGILAW